MILRPVSPASPWGPPTTKRPVGLIRMSASFTSKPASARTGRTTRAMTPSRSSALSTMSECWVETTSLLTPTGRDVARLAVDGGEGGAGLGIEPEARVRVADGADGAPHDVGDVDVGGGGDFSRHDRHARGDEGLAGDARRRVLANDGVEHSVGDLVGDLIGMAFRHRLGREH